LEARGARIFALLRLSVALAVALAAAAAFAARARAGIPDLPSPVERALFAVAHYPEPNYYSGLIETPTGTAAVFVYGTPEKIDVWTYVGSSWSKTTTLDLGCCGVGGSAPDGSFTVLPIADLPVNLTIPVVFPTRPADFAVLAEVNGSWRFVPFLPAGQSPANFVGTAGASVSGAKIVARDNNCAPDCASGAVSTSVWTYNPEQHGFTTPIASVAASPPARLGAGMVWDDATKQLLMYGGLGQHGELSDMWSWDGAQWHQISSGGPDLHAPPLVVYDEATSQLLLIGPLSTGSNATLGTWVWSGQGWSQLQASGGPPALQDAVAYDVSSGQVVLLVEAAPNGSVGSSTQTWLWDGHGWSKAHPPHAPPRTLGEPLAYDGAGRQLLLQGGGGFAPDGGFGTLTTDTWAWNGSDWTKLAPAHHPPVSPEAAMAYDANRNQVWLVDSGGSLDPGCPFGPGPRPANVWTWNGSDWSSGTAPPDLALHESAAIAYDPATKQLLLFGGCDHNGAPTGETTVLDGPQPNQVPEAQKPGAGGKCDSLIDTGFSAAYEPKWVHDINDALKNRANELAKNRGLPIPFFNVKLPAGLALTFEPQFEPFNASVCAIGLGGQLKDVLWKPPSDELSIGPPAGSPPWSTVTYSADVGGWTYAPDAPPGQNLLTVWLPDFHVAQGLSFSLGHEGLQAELDLAEIDLASVQAKWPLYVHGNQVFEAELGPTLALLLDVKKQNLIDELAKKINEIDDSGNPTDDEIKAAEQDIADEVGEDMAIEVQSFETGYLRVTVIQDLASNNAALIIESVDQAVAGELASEVSLLQPGSADLAEFEAQNVTPEALSPEATGLLEGAADGDVLLGGGKLLCIALAGGPEDIFGDIFCAVV
jgi:hypothetical protein